MKYIFETKASVRKVNALEQLAIHQGGMFLGLAVVLAVGYLFFNAVARRD